MSGQLTYTGTPKQCKAMVRERIAKSVNHSTDENLLLSADALAESADQLIDAGAFGVERATRHAGGQPHALKINVEWDLNNTGIAKFNFSGTPVPAEQDDEQPMKTNPVEEVAPGVAG
jgi:hypothetical protein